MTTRLHRIRFDASSEKLLFSPTSSDEVILPFGLFKLLKPCKVKRFLATEDRSVVGLVTGSSEINGLKWEAAAGGGGVVKKEEVKW